MKNVVHFMRSAQRLNRALRGNDATELQRARKTFRRHKIKLSSEKNQKFRKAG